MTDKPLTGLHKAARDYASRGIPIFPIRPNGKEPALSGSFENATADLRQIDAWWNDRDYNIGLEPERMGWAVVDVDTGHYPANTFTVETPSGGSHHYYVGSLPGTVRKLGPGLDTRGRRSYVLVPPSVVSGKPYTAPFFPPDDYDLAPLPEWIAQAVGSTTEKREAPPDVELDKPLAIEEARRYLCHTPAPTEGDGSDDATYRAAARLKDYGISEATALDLLEQWSGFETDWLESKIANVYHYGQNELGSDVPKSGAETFNIDISTAQDMHAVDSVSIAKGRGGRWERIDWLWQDWLPRGKLTILSGEKGVGKSTLVYHVLATITRGGQWPDGSKAPIGDILIWSAEDDWSDTIGPRLDVAGANFEHVYHVEGVKLPDGSSRTFDPATDMRGLLDAARAIPNLAAVLIDPVVSAVAGDSHKNAETRRGLQPVVDFAGARKAAVIGITHFSKNTQGRSPLDRINGSLAFGAIARMVWGAVKDDEDDTAPRRLVRIATNISAWGGGFDYTLHRAMVPGETFEAQGLSWGQFTAGSAGALIGDVQGGEERTSKIREAEAFVSMMLANDQMVEVADIKKAAEAHSVSWQTVLRAKRALGVTAKQRPGAAAAVWCWRLPPRETTGLEY